WSHQATWRGFYSGNGQTSSSLTGRTSGLPIQLWKARTGGQDARHYFERTPSDGIYLLARFRGRPATRFRVKGFLDAKSDGVAIRRADGAFCRNRYNVARGTWSGHPASNRLVRWHHWSLRGGLSALPGGFPHGGK